MGHTTSTKSPESPQKGSFNLAKQRYVNTEFWTDPWVMDRLSRDATLLFMYLLTNGRTNVTGIYEISEATISVETKISRQDLGDLFTELNSRVTYRDGWIILHNAIKHQNWRSPKIQKLIGATLAQIPGFAWEYVVIPKDLDINLLKVYGIDTVSLKKYNVSQSISGEHILRANLKSISNPPAAVDAVSEKRVVEKTSSADIDLLMKTWEESVGLEIQNDDRQRKAISRLIKERGIQKAQQLVKGVAMTLDDRYAPRIADFPTLVRKQNDLILWGRKNHKVSNVEVIS